MSDAKHLGVGASQEARQHAIDIGVETLKQLNTFGLAGLAGVLTLVSIYLSRGEMETRDAVSLGVAGLLFIIACLVNRTGMELAMLATLNPAMDLNDLRRRALISTAFLGAGLGASVSHMVLRAL